jgi:MFS family permease
LSLAGMMRATAFVSFSSAMPLYLVNVRGFAPDAAVIGATLATYGVASAVSGMLSGLLERRIGRVRLVVGSMLLAAPVLGSVLAFAAGDVRVLRRHRARRDADQRVAAAPDRERSGPGAARGRDGLRHADGAHLGDGRAWPTSASAPFRSSSASCRRSWRASRS